MNKITKILGKTYGIAIGILLVVSISSVVVVAAGGASGTEVVYRFEEPNLSPNDIAKDLGIFNSDTKYSLRGNGNWKEFVIDDGADCNERISGSQLAELHNEFEKPNEEKRYTGESIGPDCTNSTPTDSESNVVHLSVTDYSDGCRGTITGKVDSNGIIDTWEYTKKC